MNVITKMNTSDSASSRKAIDADSPPVFTHSHKVTAPTLPAADEEKNAIPSNR